MGCNARLPRDVDLFLGWKLVTLGFCAILWLYCGRVGSLRAFHIWVKLFENMESLELHLSCLGELGHWDVSWSYKGCHTMSKTSSRLPLYEFMDVRICWPYIVVIQRMWLVAIRRWSKYTRYFFSSRLSRIQSIPYN